LLKALLPLLLEPVLDVLHAVEPPELTLEAALH
jgi:hypothetical protein